MIAKGPSRRPIGVAHLCGSGLPSGITQFSAAIPDPNDRSIGRGRDLLLLTIGAAFFVFHFHELFSLIDNGNSRLIQKCLSGGFCEESDFRFLGLDVSPEPAVQILRTTVAGWSAMWGEEFEDKAKQDPWLSQHLAGCEPEPIRSAFAASLTRVPILQGQRGSDRSTIGDLPFKPPRKVLL